MFTRRYKKCFCMNNNSSCNTATNMIEDKCTDVCPCNYEDYNSDECECGFDEVFSQKILCLHKAMFLGNIWIKLSNHVLD